MECKFVSFSKYYNLVLYFKDFVYSCNLYVHLSVHLSRVISNYILVTRILFMKI